MKRILPLLFAFVLAAPSARAAAVPAPDQPVLIDTSASAGSVVASSSSSATFSADHAFDGNWADNAGRWLAYTNPDNDYGSGVHGETPMYLVYRFNAATKVNILRLRIPNDWEWDKRSPKAWTFLGSHDGETWTTLDTRSGVAWASGTTVKTFSFENETKYAYYKFNCTEIVGENNYMQLYEIQFLYDAGIVLTDLTSPSGTVTTTTAGDWVKPAKNAFDNGTAHNNDDRSIHSGTTVDWIYTFDTKTLVNAYKVYCPSTTPYNYDKRMPRTWTFEAKNAEDATWTVLDTQSNETGWTALESRYYQFANNTAYDSYRFAVTADNGGDGYIQIDELEFFFVNQGGPSIGDAALARTGARTYSLAATEDANAADLAWIANDGTSVTTNGWQSVAEGGTANWTVSGLAADTTYEISVLATNENGMAETVAGTIYTGTLSLGAATDADEAGLVTGGVTVSRADADPVPLTVNYSISGSAGTEGTTWAAPVAVTIPAGASSATLPVVPLLDFDVDEDVTITVTILAGNYELPAAATTTLTLRNRAAVKKADFAKSMTLTPSETALAKIGETAWADFPVLVRLPAEVSALLQSADGTDLFFTDENDAVLSFEIDTFDPAGETLVWVKVPSLSTATELTAYFVGAANEDNVPADVWSRYAVVVHGGDSLANAVAGGPAVSAGSSSVAANADAGRIGGGVRKSEFNAIGVNAENVASALANTGRFSVSAWFKRSSGSGNNSGTHILAASRPGWNEGSGFVWLNEQNKYIAISAPNTHQWSSGIDKLAEGVWAHVAFAYEKGVSLTSFFNGAQDNRKTSGLGNLENTSGTWTFGSYANKASGDSFKGDMDELRIFDGVASGDWIALEYATMADAAFFAYGDVEPVDPTATVFKTPTIVRNANGSYTVTVELSENNGDVGVVYDGGATAITNIIQQNATPGTYTDTPENLAAGTTYAFAAYGKNANDTEVTKKGGVFYNGDLTVARVSDANETGLVPGVFRISRADTAYDLPVAYTVGGTAVAGQTYETLSGTATIPAGTNCVDIAVVPLLDSATTSNTTVTVTLAAGLYGIDAQAGSAELTVVNLVTPAGYNVWIAPSNSLASIGSNWSAGHCPTAQENVLFDGNFSTAACEWDAAASATVASWTQTNGYTGTVTFDTEFPDYSGATFTLFTISGDCVIASGKWSCRGNYNNFGASVTPMNTYKTAKRWCLNVAVGGAMRVASGTAITGTGRGYGYTSGVASPAYGGYAWGGGSAPYGSIKEPFEPGLGSRSQGDQNNRISAIGGGAIKLAVSGALTLDGSVVALGTADQNIARTGGTGGSIWISASQISGAGTIDASAPTGIGNDQIVGTGSGGRIALYTQSPLAFPMANVACSGTGYRGTSWQSNSRVSGPGTIYVYDPTQTYGTLYVKQSTAVSTQNTKWTGTPVMGDLALDAVVLSGCTSLRIPADTSLTLPSLAAVTTDNTGSGSAGLVCDGGTLNIGNGDQTLKANVAFSSPTAFAFPGDLTLETGAKLGSLNSVYGTEAHCYDQTFTVSVAGDLTIPAGAYAGATRCCALTASGKARFAASHGGQSLYLAAAARTNGFDSILSPSMPGGSANRSFPAGGAFTLTVGGTLTLDGAITADGGEARGSGSTYDGTSAGAGGTINVTARALAGEGKITADGGCGAAYYAGGAGGGRVAVRLTGAGSSFADRWTTNILARGQSLGSKTDKASSAGTVYLQTAKDGEAGGLVIVRNDLAVQAGAANNPATTRFPGNGDGCDAPKALKRASLLVADAAHVEISDPVRIVELDVESGSSIDLHGQTFTVTTAHVDGRNVIPGVYTAAQLQASGFEGVVDTSEGADGTLVVHGRPTILIVR